MAQYKSYLTRYDPSKAEYVRLTERGSDGGKDIQCLVSFRPEDADAPPREDEAETDSAYWAIQNATNSLNTNIFKNSSKAVDTEDTESTPYVVITQNEDTQYSGPSPNLFLENFSIEGETEEIADIKYYLNTTLVHLTDKTLPVKFYKLMPPDISASTVIGHEQYVTVTNRNFDACILSGSITGKLESTMTFTHNIATSDNIIVEAGEKLELTEKALGWSSGVHINNTTFAKLKFTAVSTGKSYRWTPEFEGDEMKHPKPPESEEKTW